MRIYLTGIDGSGKTTLANRLKQELEKTAPCRIVWARYEPRLVGWLSARIRKRQTRGRDDYHRMSADDYRRWRDFKRRLVRDGRLSRALYFLQYLDYAWQIRKIPPRAAGEHLVVDRYVLDFLVDQTVNHGDLSRSPWTRRLLRRLGAFDSVLFIDVAPEVALSRKTDIPSAEYLEERRAAYRDYVARIPNGRTVANNGALDDAWSEIKGILRL